MRRMGLSWPITARLWREPVSCQPGVLTPVQAVAGAAILGARTLAPIHYGISGMDNHAEVDDRFGRPRKAAGDRAVAVQVVEPGAWLKWPA